MSLFLKSADQTGKVAHHVHVTTDILFPKIEQNKISLKFKSSFLREKLPTKALKVADHVVGGRQLVDTHVMYLLLLRLTSTPQTEANAASEAQLKCSRALSKFANQILNNLSFLFLTLSAQPVCTQ